MATTTEQQTGTAIAGNCVSSVFVVDFQEDTSLLQSSVINAFNAERKVLCTLEYLSESYIKGRYETHQSRIKSINLTYEFSKLSDYDKAMLKDKISDLAFFVAGEYPDFDKADYRLYIQDFMSKAKEDLFNFDELQFCIDKLNIKFPCYFTGGIYSIKFFNPQSAEMLEINPSSVKQLIVYDNQSVLDCFADKCFRVQAEPSLHELFYKQNIELKIPRIANLKADLDNWEYHYRQLEEQLNQL